MGLMAPPFGQLGGIAAFTGVEAINDVFIPAALAGGDGALLHEFHHFIGLGAIAHQVAEACDGCDALLVDVVQHGFERREVGMQAGDHGVGHRQTGGLKSGLKIGWLVPQRSLLKLQHVVA